MHTSIAQTCHSTFCNPLKRYLPFLPSVMNDVWLTVYTRSDRLYWHYILSLEYAHKNGCVKGEMHLTCMDFLLATW